MPELPQERAGLVTMGRGRRASLYLAAGTGGLAIQKHSLRLLPNAWITRLEAEICSAPRPSLLKLALCLAPQGVNWDRETGLLAGQQGTVTLASWGRAPRTSLTQPREAGLHPVKEHQPHLGKPS